MPDRRHAFRSPRDLGWSQMTLMTSIGRIRSQLGGPLEGDRALLLELLQGAPRIPLLITLASLACRMALDHSEVEGLFRGAILSDANPEHAQVRRSIAADSNTVIANEAACLWLQGMALRHCPDEGQPLNDLGVAVLFLAANDFCTEWPERPLTSARLRRAHQLASGVRLMFFNRHPDIARESVRFVEILDGPSRSHFTTSVLEWEALQRAAFHGYTAREFLARLLFPLVITAQLWDGKTNGPVTNPATYLAATDSPPEVVLAFFAELSQTLSQAKAQADELGESGALTALGFHHPFLCLDDGRLLCLSPRLLDMQLSEGIPARMRTALAATTDPNSASSRWGQGFGLLVEDWLRRMVADAATSSVALREASTDVSGLRNNQLTDLAFVRGRHVVLVESKARTMAKEVVKVSKDPAEAEAFFRELLFKPKGGALVQLDRAVRRVRAGEAEGVGIPRDALVTPLIVHYGPLALDNPLARLWVEAERAERHLLSQDRVRPITFMSVATFEALLAGVAAGEDIFALLERWNSARHLHEQRFEVFLSKTLEGKDVRRLPLVESALEELSAATRARFTARTADNPTEHP